HTGAIAGVRWPSFWMVGEHGAGEPRRLRRFATAIGGPQSCQRSLSPSLPIPHAPRQGQQVGVVAMSTSTIDRTGDIDVAVSIPHRRRPIVPAVIVAAAMVAGVAVFLATRSSSKA